MLQYVHGGDIQTYIDRHGFAPLDLSANINPFGIPDAVRAAMHRAVDNCTQYPDPFCRTARQAIGAREGVNPDFLYCGNGAADVLDRLAAVLKPRKVLLTAPTFAEYERTLSGAEIRVHNLRETDGFALTERILDEISPDLDAVYLCNPNNPTGRTAQPELLREIVRKCTENGVKLVVDECFNDFLTDAERHTRKDLLESNPGLIILRAYENVRRTRALRLVHDGGHGAHREGALPRRTAVERVGHRTGVRRRGGKRAGLGRRDRQTHCRTQVFIRRTISPRTETVFPGEANFLLFRSNDTGLRRETRGARHNDTKLR